MNISERVRNDKWYFIVIFFISLFFVFIFLNREMVVEVIQLKLTDIHIFGKTYTLDLFDGVLFTLFILATIFSAWYFGGHNAYLITAISWNFEIILFIAITNRIELLIELVNIPICLILYFKESPADKKNRLHNEMIEKKNEELIKLNISYSRFVPIEFLKYLNKNSISEVELGDAVQQEMSVLFSDIRFFTKISENMTPRQNFEFINQYLSHIGPCVRENNGFIDKYIGDAIMALFPSQRIDAVKCALLMRKKLFQYNEAMKRKKLEPIEAGIGIHSGLLMLGTIGEEKRMDSTVIADAVNLSSRLEALTKVYKAPVIISEAIYFAIKDLKDFHCRYIDTVKVKGKESSIPIFELIDEYSDNGKKKIKTLEKFKSAMLLFQQKNYLKSISLFKEISEMNTEDSVASIYFQRCQDLLISQGHQEAGDDVFE